MANSPDKIDRLTDQQASRLAALSVKQQTATVDIERIAREMQLRQWCIEQAVAVQGDSPLFISEQPSLDGSIEINFATVDVAARIFDFVTTPLREQQ